MRRIRPQQLGSTRSKRLPIFGSTAFSQSVEELCAVTPGQASPWEGCVCGAAHHGSLVRLGQRAVYWLTFSS